MLIIGHRGYGNNIYNDNTFESYNNAFKNGFDMIELDIQLCKSGEIILYHDVYLKNKLIQNLDYCDIYIKEIRTLNDFFIEFYKPTMKLLFDIKGGHENLIVNKILLLFDKFNVDYTNVLMSSFNKRIIQDLIKYQKIYNYKLGLISDNNFYYDEIKYQLDKIDFISINFEMLLVCDIDLLRECKNKNIKIFTWTVTNKDIYDLIKDLPIDGLISDIKLS